VVLINQVDQPVPKIKKAIKRLLPKDEAEYILSLDEFVNYTRVIGERFWGRMGKAIGAR
jgi:hypothetical protein